MHGRAAGANTAQGRLWGAAVVGGLGSRQATGHRPRRLPDAEQAASAHHAGAARVEAAGHPSGGAGSRHGGGAGSGAEASRRGVARSREGVRDAAAASRAHTPARASSGPRGAFPSCSQEHLEPEGASGRLGWDASAHWLRAGPGRRARAGLLGLGGRGVLLLLRQLGRCHGLLWRWHRLGLVADKRVERRRTKRRRAGRKRGRGRMSVPWHAHGASGGQGRAAVCVGAAPVWRARSAATHWLGARGGRVAAVPHLGG